MIPSENSRHWSRRGFVKAAAGAATYAGLAKTVHAKAPGHPFEVVASLYAWELHDEGVEHVLDNLQTMASVNSVYLISIMHYEKRPFTSPTFPHNPVRKTWQAEDSRCYWHPEMKLYGRIMPQLSSFPWLSDTDWLDVLTKAARKRGLKTGAELSHTLVDLDTVKQDLLDCTQRDIHDQPRVVWGRSYPLCPNNPDVMEYTLALYTDLVKNHDVDFTQFCTITMLNGGADRGSCFCESCLKAIRPHLDSIRNSDYSEQLGDPSRMHEKDDRLKANTAALGEEFPRISAVAVRPKATPELIHEGVHIALENKVCGLSLGHYDGAEFPLLRAISEGLQTEHVSVPKRLAHQTWKGRIA